MTNRQAILIGGCMILGLFVWSVGTLGLGYRWYGGVNPVWLFGAGAPVLSNVSAGFCQLVHLQELVLYNGTKASDLIDWNLVYDSFALTVSEEKVGFMNLHPEQKCK